MNKNLQEADKHNNIAQEYVDLAKAAILENNKSLAEFYQDTARQHADEAKKYIELAEKDLKQQSRKFTKRTWITITIYNGLGLVAVGDFEKLLLN